MLPGTGTAATIAGGLVSLVLMALVLLSFRHGVPGEGLAWRLGVAGRWVLLAGLGGWFGFALLGRLTLLVERASFLLFEWLKIGS